MAELCRNKRWIWASWVVALALGALLTPGAARAVDIFEFQIYGSRTQGAGNFAPQFLTSLVAKGSGEAGAGIPEQNTFRTAVELEFGLTDKIDFAYYFNVATDREGTQYTGSKFRLRGAFAEPGALPIDIGWYAEIEWWRPRFDDDRIEAEVMLTMQKNFGAWALVLNLPDIEKVIWGVSARDVFELGWRAEARYRYSERVHFGLQTFGGLGAVNAIGPVQQQTHYLVPVVHVAMARAIKATFGIVFGMTQASDVVLLKTNLTFNSNDEDWD